MKLYTMMPLMKDHIDEMCDNIADQYARGIANEALFIMTLQPEGDPASDKAADYCKTYDIYAEKLAKRGLKCGTLKSSGSAKKILREYKNKKWYAQRAICEMRETKELLKSYDENAKTAEKITDNDRQAWIKLGHKWGKK